MQRLDGLRCSLVNIATDTGVATRDVLGALRLLLDVEKREAALLGLDAASEPVSPITPTVLDTEIARLTRELVAFDALPPRDSWTDSIPHGAAADDHPNAAVVPLTDHREDRR